MYLQNLRRESNPPQSIIHLLSQSLMMAFRYDVIKGINISGVTIGCEISNSNIITGSVKEGTAVVTLFTTEWLNLVARYLWCSISSPALRINSENKLITSIHSSDKIRYTKKCLTPEMNESIAMRKNTCILKCCGLHHNS